MGARTTTTERVKFYKNNFMRFHEEGYSIPEIAGKCNISCGHAYALLQEIADANEVTREELLKIKDRKKPQFLKSSKIATQFVDSAELASEFDNTLKSVDNILEDIDRMINI